MSVKITALSLDTEHKKITLSAKVEVAGNTSTLTGYFIDLDNTFVCSNQPSTLATFYSVPTSWTDWTSTTVGSNTEYTKTDSTLGITTTYTVVTATNKIIEVENAILDLSDALISGCVSTVDINNNMFFVFAEIDGATVSGVRTGEYAIGTVFDQNTLYRSIFNIIHKSITTNKCCSIPQEAENITLLFEAFIFALATGDVRKAIYYWNKLKSNNIITTNTCNCNV